VILRTTARSTSPASSSSRSRASAPASHKPHADDHDPRDPGNRWPILSPTLTIIVTTFHGPRLPRPSAPGAHVAGAGGPSVSLGRNLTGWASWRLGLLINVPSVSSRHLAVMYCVRCANATPHQARRHRISARHGGLARRSTRWWNTTSTADSSTSSNGSSWDWLCWRRSYSGERNWRRSARAVQDFRSDRSRRRIYECSSLRTFFACGTS